MNEPIWSSCDTDVLSRARETLDAGESAALVTVVGVDGSAYRRPGAKMLLPESGERAGSVTPGCLEAELFDTAAEVLDADEPRIRTYDLTNDDEDVWGLGVGCNGVVDLLIEPLDASYDRTLEAVEARDPIGVLTVLSSETLPLGFRGHYRPERGFDDRLPTWLVDDLADEVETLFEADGSKRLRVTSGSRPATVFADVISPPPRLVVLGTGTDVVPVTELGARCGFEVSVVGFRGAKATEDRFPAADTVVSTSPARLRDAHPFDERTYPVVMTHNFVDDRIALTRLLRTPVPYIGLLGPRKRFEELRTELVVETGPLTAADRERIYAPVGLDLGAGSPSRIAHSIVAEVLAVHNDREPGHLSDREGPIHPRPDEVTE